MSYKNPSLPKPIGRLAPLATAAALLCAASASMAQVVVNQTNTGVPLGTTTAVINTNTGSATFAHIHQRQQQCVRCGGHR